MLENGIVNILNRVHELHLKNDTIEKLKGEHFNIFSILKMDTKENGTHSAFINELLDPHGAHNKVFYF